MKYRGFVIKSENGRHVAASTTDDITFTSRGLDRLHQAINDYQHATGIVGLETLRRIGVDVFAMADWLRTAIASGRRTINLDSAMEA